MPYEIQTLTLCDSWTSCVTSPDTGEAVQFPSHEAAAQYLAAYLQDQREAVAAGDMAEEYSPEDFRIIQTLGA